MAFGQPSANINQLWINTPVHRPTYYYDRS